MFQLVLPRHNHQTKTSETMLQLDLEIRKTHSTLGSQMVLIILKEETSEVAQRHQ